jgi:hypothetical protein
VFAELDGFATNTEQRTTCTFGLGVLIWISRAGGRIERQGGDHAGQPVSSSQAMTATARNSSLFAKCIPSQERIENVADDADLEEVYDSERHLLDVAAPVHVMTCRLPVRRPRPNSSTIWRIKPARRAVAGRFS